MTTRRLQQVHPPKAAPGLATIIVSNETDINIVTSLPDRWEGSVRLDDGRTVPFLAHREGKQVHVWNAGESYISSPAAPIVRSRGSRQNTSDDIVCPVPGVVIAVHVAADDVVESGQDLVIIESMKTEQVVKSPRDCTVQRVSVQDGDRVDRGMRLVVLVPFTEE